MDPENLKSTLLKVPAMEKI